MLYGSLNYRIERIPFLDEFLVLVIPLLGSVTVFAERPLLLFILLCGCAGLVSLLPKRSLPPPLSPSVRIINGRETEGSERAPGSTERKPKSIPAVTVYRSHMMLMTVICILAVDFPIFPRSLAKCETFGVSVVSLTPSPLLLN